MKREELEKLGLEKEAIDQIMAMAGKDLEAHKVKLSTAEQEIASVRTQYDEATKQIESFKSMDIEGVRKSADEWKTKAEQAAKDAQAQIAQMRFDHALDGALISAKAKNVKAVRALLSTADMKLTDSGDILGLDDQLKKIKTEADYLFESDQPAPKITAGGGNSSQNIDPAVAAFRAAAGLK